MIADFINLFLVGIVQLLREGKIYILIKQLFAGIVNLDIQHSLMLAFGLYARTAILLHDLVELFIIEFRIIEGKVIGILLFLCEMLHRAFLFVAFIIGVIGSICILCHNLINTEAACNQQHRYQYQQHQPLWIDMSVPFVFRFHHYFPPVYL